MPRVSLKATFLAIFSLATLLSIWRLYSARHTVYHAAVGISLSPSYGTLALRHASGTFENIARVDGDPEYVQLMQRLSLLDSTHPSPPYRTMEELWSDVPRQATRRARKTLGLAASPDAAIISAVLRDLIAQAEAQLDVRIRPTVISYPRLAALYEEDVGDAAARIGLHLLDGPPHSHQPHELVATYAGNGMGLCAHHRDDVRCRLEKDLLPLRDVLSVQVTRDAYVLSLERLSMAIDVANWDLPSIAQLDARDIPSQAASDVLRLLKEEYATLVKPKEITIVFSGERGSESAIQEAVEKAVEGFGATAKSFSAEPEYAAARGAAEFAWRAMPVSRATEPDTLR